MFKLIVVYLLLLSTFTTGFLPCRSNATEGELSDSMSVNNSHIAITISAPDSGWRIRIHKVYQVDNELWVISILSRIEGQAVQKISKCSDNVAISKSHLPVKHFVLGKTWNWAMEKNIVYIESYDEIEKMLKSGKLLFEKE